jgi:hypothetical protein
MIEPLPHCPDGPAGAHAFPLGPGMQPNGPCTACGRTIAACEEEIAQAALAALHERFGPPGSADNPGPDPAFYRPRASEPPRPDALLPAAQPDPGLAYAFRAIDELAKLYKERTPPPKELRFPCPYCRVPICVSVPSGSVVASAPEVRQENAAGADAEASCAMCDWVHAGGEPTEPCPCQCHHAARAGRTSGVDAGGHSPAVGPLPPFTPAGVALSRCPVCAPLVPACNTHCPCPCHQGPEGQP